jgi:hypothetical protein
MDDFFGFMVSAVFALCAAMPISFGFGMICITLAATVVDVFKLNSNGSYLGMKVLNVAVVISFLSYFFIFAYFMRFFL